MVRMQTQICFLWAIVFVAYTTATPNDHYYAVVLAGGKGERLWPLSRENKPKQFLEFLQNKTLIEHAIARVTSFIPKKNIWIITNQAYLDQVHVLFGNTLGGVISEPAARNTAPAVLLACLTIIEKDPQATIAFLPADHHIKEEAIFSHGLHTVLNKTSTSDAIGLIGLKPTYPATGLGYIEYDYHSCGGLHAVLKFHEKPQLAVAKEYFDVPNMLWNGGYFCGKASVFINHFKELTPLLYELVESYMHDEGSYASLPDISFDNAVLEKTSSMCVMPLAVTWSDVGNLKTFLSAKDNWQHNMKNVVNIDSENNLIHNPHTLTALLGVDDLCIINTQDVLIVAHQNDVERVKEVLQRLNNAQKMALSK